MLSAEAMVGWLTAGPPLLQDGPLRGMTAVGRLAAGEFPARADVAPPPADCDAPARRRAVQLGGVALWAAALIVLTDQQPAWGVNLFVGQVAVLVVALVLLARAVWRLA